MLLTQKHIRNLEELLEKLSKIYETLQTQEERNNFKRNIVYIIKATPKNQNIIEIINKKIDKPINKVIMSLYEEITLKGIEIGRMEGRLEGKLEGKVDFVLALHSDGFDTTQISKYTKLTDQEILEILKKSGRIK